MNILAKKIAVFTFLFVSLSVFAHLLKIIFYLIVPFVVFSLAYVSNFISIGVNEPQQYVYLLDSVSLSFSYLIIGYVSEYLTVSTDKMGVKLDENDNPLMLKKIPPYLLSFMCSLSGAGYIFLVNEDLSIVIILTALLISASFVGSKTFLVIKKARGEDGELI